MPRHAARKTLAVLALAALPALAVATLPFAPPAAVAQESGGASDLESLVTAVASATDTESAYPDALRLIARGSAAVQPVAEAAESDQATPAGRLALGRVLISLRERPRAQKALLRVASAADVEIALRSDAVRLLAETTEDAEDGIHAVLDGALDARLRASCAYSLWRLVKDPAAKNVLREMVRSSDPDLQVEGALALGEVGDFGPGVQEILQRVRVEPTFRGRLAASLLDRETWEKVRTPPAPPAPPAAPAAPAAPGGPMPSGLPALLDEILRNLRGVYVHPEDIDVTKLAEGAAHGYVNGLGDPYTQFQDIEERDEWTENLNKKYGGIGAYVGFDQDGIFSITRPMFGGPAWKANLRAGTRVLRIEDWDTSGHSVDDIVKRLRGTPGTPVKILIQKPGWKEPQEMTLTRAPIAVPSVNSTILPGGIGYVVVDNFAADTAQEFRTALREFERASAKGLIVDLRFNSGGYLNTAQEMADILLPAGRLVVETKGRAGEDRDSTYVTEGKGTDWTRNVPLTVLTNEFSASASEILSGCLKAHGRAKIVGTRTFGKGSVQNIFYLFTPPFAEPFTDTNGNAAWDGAEPFQDSNHDGTWTAGEPYRDWNGNRKWDGAEPFTDRNGNGRYDAPAVKITIAKYYVGRRPGTFEFNPSRKEMVVSNRRVWLGGVEPDVPVASEEFEGWRAEETSKIDRSTAFDRYLGENRAFFEANKETFRRLATSDSRNPADWPGFEEFYKSLDTKLSRDEVWYWLHLRMRSEVSNDVGRLLVGDYVTDQQIQRAIRDLMERPGNESVLAAPEYRFIEQKKFDVPPTYGAEELAKARPARNND